MEDTAGQASRQQETPEQQGTDNLNMSTGDNSTDEFYDPNITVPDDSMEDLSHHNAEVNSNSTTNNNHNDAKDNNNNYHNDTEKDDQFKSHRDESFDSPGTSGSFTPAREDTPYQGKPATTPGLSSLMGDMGTIAKPKPQLSEQHQSDLSKVREAFREAGGLTQRAPDLEKLTAREGQSLEIFGDDLDIGELEDEPERPADSKLEKIPEHVLLPPESTSIVPLDFQMDYTLPEFVKEHQRRG